MFFVAAARAGTLPAVRKAASGFSLGFHLSSITAGGAAPLIATALLAATGSGYVIALYVLF
jgi:hypothetical protein